MPLKRTLSVFLLLAGAVVLNPVCSAAPLMVEKNLFAADRKAPPPESADASSQPAKPSMAISNIQLDGVIMQSNAKRAVLRMKNPPPGAPAKKGQAASPFVTVREGQMVSDYRVSKIEPKSITLEKDSQTFTVGLFAANKVLPPMAPAPPPVAVQPPTGAPGVAPTDVEVNQPLGVPPQPGVNPEYPQPAQAPVPNPGVAGIRGRRGNIQQNVYAPAPEPAINPDPNQPAETIEEEE